MSRGLDSVTAGRVTRWMRGRFAALALSLVATLGCQDPGAGADAGPSVATRWAAARALWHIDRDPAAYAAWRAIDPRTQEGREARALLEEAEPVYRAGIHAVRRGEPGARETLERAVRIAPMDPDLYLPLARAFRAQGVESPENPHLFIRAAEYYRKFLLLSPAHPEADAARRELAAIDPEGSRIFDPPAREAEVEPARVAPEPPAPRWPLGVAVAALVLALGAMALLVVRRRGARLSLEALADRRPELHPAIAYLVGSLRHELLKHRVGAVGDAVGALEAGRASAQQLDFLCGRLFGGEPLERAWGGHVGAFERALGPDLDLGRDRALRRAERAIRALAALEPRLIARDPRAIGRLARAYAELSALDRHLARFVHRLVRTSVDGALLREVVDEVRTEYAAGNVPLDDVVIRAPSPAPLVEVFRVDLVLVLKNVVRNAILAVGADDPPRRVGLHVETQIELTGEEIVRIHVADTSAQRFSTEDIYARRMDRGLGLVTAALSRYDGAIAVEPGSGEWQKTVVVRFFRAYAEDERG